MIEFLPLYSFLALITSPKRYFTSHQILCSCHLHVIQVWLGRVASSFPDSASNLVPGTHFLLGGHI